MANDNHLFPVPCYNGTMLKQDYYNDFFDFGQQKINFSFFELHLPDDDPVYTLKKVMEELDFSGLLACCSDQGRTRYNPIMLYAVVTYANMRGIRAVDRIVELCERDLAFIWQMSITTSAMMGGNCGICGRKAGYRMGIPRPLKYMAVQTAAAVNIRRNVCTNMMLKSIQTETRS